MENKEEYHDLVLLLLWIFGDIGDVGVMGEGGLYGGGGRSSVLPGGTGVRGVVAEEEGCGGSLDGASLRDFVPG